MAAQLMLTAWEQAFGLMETLGCCGASDLVVDGIRAAGPGQGEVVDQWIAIGERLNAIVQASGTRH